MENVNQGDIVTRPPIVVVMGHIDHGKTTLLDYIRKTGVAVKESGGITQHIGAYEVKVPSEITFIDTPGHEAFGKMRSRGAKVADIAILVVAADDGVRPQTKEALEAIKSAGIPFAVAVNKIDKPAANPEKTKNELAEAGVFLEGRGGNVPCVEISAKTGEGVPKLLETLLLIAELENLQAHPAEPASGVVIESHRDARRGVTATLLIRNGTLKKRDFVAAKDAVAKIKILETFNQNSIESAGPSSPVVAVGFDKLPAVGAEFKTFSSQKDAHDAARFANLAAAPPKGIVSPNDSGQKLTVGLVIKTDVEGSAEAILHEIDKLSVENQDKIELRVLRAGAGDISEDDVKLASSAARPLVLGFKVGAHQTARELAEKMKITISVFDIIYEIPDFLRKRIEEAVPPCLEKKVSGRAQIIKIFPSKLKGQIVGGKVLDGVLMRGAPFQLLRKERKIAEGTIDNLQSGKINVPEARAGEDFGAHIVSKIQAAPGDVLEIFVE